ncbi:MAG: ADP-heptose--LPS heptosyltransferase RfaF [Leeuwenhoekiella sp.]|nr:ADP-heptose--LPS heptosyltransferase RfaF [Leeuwenhoekiella sp.]MBA80016.1 ADP-heptose--LPS heptosyltransferase RfaF [Leeuwenhoekiella sp.]
MGDVAMTVPVLIALTRTYPNLEVTVVSRPFFLPFFEPLERVHFFGADVKGTYKGAVGLYRLYKDLEPSRFTAIADLHNVIRSNVLRSFFRLRGSKSAQIDKGRAEKKALTREHNKDFRPLKSTHARYAEVFEKLGYPVQLTGNELLAKQPITDSIRAHVGHEPQKWLGIAPFAAHAGKHYPLELMDAVLAQLNKEPYKIILFGGGAEETQTLQSFADKYPNCVSVAGRFSFAEELALISHLDAMLAMDSGNGHLAALFGIPVVTMWGVTHPYLGFTPYGQPEENQLLSDRKQFPAIPTSVYGNKVPADYEKAMYSIKPQQVVDRIKTILA